MMFDQISCRLPSSSSSNLSFVLGDQLSGVDKAGRLALLALLSGTAAAAAFYLCTDKDRETGRRTVRNSIIRLAWHAVDRPSCV